MPTLQAFLEGRSGNAPEHAQIGETTDWLSFCEVQITSGKVFVCDPAFAPAQTEEMEVVVSLRPGRYQVEARGIAFGTDRRVAALRCVLTGCSAWQYGEKRGEVGVDTGRVGLCDAQAFLAVLDEVGEHRFEQLLDDAPLDTGVIDLSGAVSLPFVASGFGDGTYPVIELRNGSEVVGFEVLFIAADEKYPFGDSKTPEKGSEDPAVAFLQQVLTKAKQKEAANERSSKDALRAATMELVQEQQRTF